MTNYLANAIGHAKTVHTHRALVRKYCFKAGIPLQGIVHDLSKYHPAEFLSGVKYYSGKHSPNVEEREEYGYSRAWLHHKGRNKHHFEYWFDNSVEVFEMVPVEMPRKYIIEMFCDRIAASIVYHGDSYTDATPLKYFSMFDYSKLMHPNTYAQIKELLEMLAEEGEDATFAYIRKQK